jgi:hypothetical protein
MNTTGAHSSLSPFPHPHNLLYNKSAMTAPQLPAPLLLRTPRAADLAAPAALAAQALAESLPIAATPSPRS